MKKYVFVEILCVILTVLFVASSLKTDDITHMTAKEIADELLYVLDDETLIERNEIFITETFEIDISEFSSVSYYSSGDIVNVTEIFIGIPKTELSPATKELIISYNTDKFNLFRDYAPEEAAYLSAYILDEASGAVIYCVAENAHEVHDAFSKLVD